MKLRSAQEILACLPRGKTPVFYYKHRYAASLLSYRARRNPTIAELRRTPYSRLLDIPFIRTALAAAGDGRLHSAHFDYLSPDCNLPFLLTLDLWSGSQVTRPGTNLVLQLNFTYAHDVPFRRLTRPSEPLWLRCASHPVLKPGQRELFRETLAWARLDVDFDSGEALIEEIQSDWMSSAAIMRARLRRAQTLPRPVPPWWHMGGSWAALQLYLDKVLRPYEEIWDEAMLWAAIEFVYRELGLTRIYFHTYDTGIALKRIAGGKPPRSLYTRLPQRFCFELSPIAPEFLLRHRGFRRHYRAMRAPRWYRMEI